MSIRRLNCPNCNAAVNVPAGMANVQCPKCSTVWNTSNPGAARAANVAASRTQPSKPSAGAKATSSSSIAAMIGGAVLILVVAGIGIFFISRPDAESNQPTPAPEAAAPVAAEPAVGQRVVESFRVVKLPEEHRRRIYQQTRQTARVTTEKPLLVPQGGAVRQSLETMLQGTHDLGLTQIAALHDISVEDVGEIVKEGDAKQWDPSPRSNAVRGGERVNPEAPTQP